MSTTVRYTAAERASFELVPETCPEVERAIDAAFYPMGFSAERVQEILAKYDIKLPVIDARKLGHAIGELVSRELFKRKMSVTDAVHFDGTFPLRLALVEEIARTRGLDNERCNYAYWLRSHRPAKEATS